MLTLITARGVPDQQPAPLRVTNSHNLTNFYSNQNFDIAGNFDWESSFLVIILTIFDNNQEF